MKMRQLFIIVFLLSPFTVWAQEDAAAEIFKKSVVSQVMAFNAEIDSFSIALKKAREEKSPDTMLIIEQRKGAVNKCFQVPQDYIKANPSSMFCFQALGMLGSGSKNSPVSVADLERLFSSLSPKLRGGETGKRYSAQLDSWTWMHKLLQTVEGPAALKSISQQDARQQLEQGAGKKAVISRSMHRSLRSREDKDQETSLMEEKEIIVKVKAATLIVNMAYKKKDGEKMIMGSNAATAYAIDPSGICVTNYHVVKEYSGKGPYFSLSVMTAGGKAYPVSAILAASESDDLAILKVDTGGDPIAALSLGNQAEIESDVFVVGHPISSNGKGGVLQEFYKLSTGKVTTNRSAVLAGKPCQVMEITAEFTKGSSGGPIVDGFGNVVGTVSRLNGEKKIGVPVSELKKLIEFKKLRI